MQWTRNYMFPWSIVFNKHFNFLALQQALLGDVKWMANPTHTKPLHNKRLAT
jgi:hypothetical protein